MADFTGTHELRPGSGRVLVKTGRAGLAARAGHDLTLEIVRWSARVTVPDAEGGGLSAATVTAELDLGSLAVREGTGGAKPLTERDRRDIQGTAGKILGEAAKATFTSSRVIPSSSASAAPAGGTPAGGAIEGMLTMRGTSRPLRLQVVSPAPGQYRGSATVKQTDFGITPYSGFFGTLKLKDEIGVEFEVTIEEIPNGSA
ncbi:YceI family protein [Trebonia kvetii]|uniref:YceI family protein n=1 Tax=Trebonia kvetii TaxID=2480626 RepID=UPI001651E1ED|nr:YceI family protein [Trebonia kvetii]